jgi:NADH dehydrogenase FAD-containing subunit
MKTAFFSFVLSLVVIGTSMMTMSFDVTPPQTTILVLRHAETQDGTCTTALSETGKNRAALLKDLFRSTDISQVYSCGHTGTMATIAPLASGKGLSAAKYDPADLKKSLHKMYTDNLGGTIVVCGDDATVAEILSLLTGERSGNLNKESRGVIYQIKSQYLGKGEMTKVPFATHI